MNLKHEILDNLPNPRDINLPNYFEKTIIEEKKESGLSDEEIAETLAICLVVGGSITIPEIRRAVDILEQLRKKESKGESLEDLL